MVRGITKYSALVTEPESILYHLEKAVHLACSGRPGPCWLTIPIDVQAAQITPSSLPKFDPGELPPLYDHGAIPAVSRGVLARLKTAKRPVLLGGTGVRLSGAENLFLEVAETLGIPVTTAWTHDLIPSSHGLFCGRPGTIGTRAGNFTVQNADVMLAIGTRLNIRQTGYSWKDFAPGACLIQVDIDPAELNKPTIRPHLPIVCDARFFLGELHRQLLEAGWQRERFKEWLAWCRSRVERYPPVLASQRTTINGINPYFFLETLFDLLQEDDVIVTGNGAACVMTFQVSALKKGQRLFSNSGSASMGYDLPAAIGAAIAGGHRRVICLAGDGSIQMNLQELQTIVHHHLPIKILVLNNQGYLSIRMTQKNFFGACFGEGPSTGVSFPDIVAVASAYRLAACKIAGASFREQTQEFLDREGPALAEIVLDPDQGFEPKPSSRPLADGRIVSAPLHDMAPFLPREELAENLLGPLHAYLDQE